MPQQQHCSKVQCGQSLIDLLALQLEGEHPQSAHLNSIKRDETLKELLLRYFFITRYQKKLDACVFGNALSALARDNA